MFQSVLLKFVNYMCIIPPSYFFVNCRFTIAATPLILSAAGTHISKSPLMRWNKRFDGTKASLRDKSHRPITPHPNAHTQTGLKWIKDLHRKNPHISVCEMYGKLRSQKGYSRHPGSLYRIYNALGFSSKAPSIKKK